MTAVSKCPKCQCIVLQLSVFLLLPHCPAQWCLLRTHHKRCMFLTRTTPAFCLAIPFYLIVHWTMSSKICSSPPPPQSVNALHLFHCDLLPHIKLHPRTRCCVCLESLSHTWIDILPKATFVYNLLKPWSYSSYCAAPLWTSPSLFLQPAVLPEPGLNLVSLEVITWEWSSRVPS